MGAWHLEEGCLWWNCIGNIVDWLVRASSVFKLVWKLKQDWLENMCLYPVKWLKKCLVIYLPQFHIPTHFGMLVLVKFMHPHNLLDQKLIQFIINLSEYQLASSLIQLIRQPVNSSSSPRKEAGMRPLLLAAATTYVSVEWSQIYKQSEPRILFHPVCQWQKYRLMQPVTITSVHCCMRPLCCLVLLWKTPLQIKCLQVVTFKFHYSFHSNKQKYEKAIYMHFKCKGTHRLEAHDVDF